MRLYRPACMVFKTISILVFAVLLMNSGDASAQTPRDPAAILEERITELRKEAEFTEALEIAKELLALRHVSEESKLYQIADAERMVVVLEFITRLSHDEQLELAKAERLSEQAEAHYQKLEYDQAANLLDQQLTILKRIMGDEHPEVATALSNLGGALTMTGDFEEAEQLQRESLAMTIELLGNEHPDVASTLNNLAMLWYRQQDLKEAERLYRDALALSRKLLGNEHPDIATMLINLATVVRENFDDAGADLLLREALVINRKAYGNEHIIIARDLAILAGFLHFGGDNAAAEPLYREALAMYRRLDGDENASVAMTLRGLARVLEYKGNFEEAETLYREALDIYRGLLGEEHPAVIGNLLALGELLQKKGDFAEAELVVREALMLHRKLRGADNPSVAISLGVLAELLRAKGDYEAAEPLFHEVIAIHRANGGNVQFIVEVRLTQLARLLEEKGDYVGAERLEREVASIARVVHGDDEPGLAFSLTHCAELQQATGNYASAESTFSQAAIVYEAARLRAGSGYTPATFHEASPYRGLACTRLAMGEFTGAWPAAERDLGRKLADLLSSAGHRSLTSSEAAEEDSLKMALGTMESELYVFREAAITDTTAATRDCVAEARNQLIDAKANWGRFQHMITNKYPVSEGRAFPLERVQAVLDGRTAIVGWLDVKERKDEFVSWGYVIREQGSVVWERVGTSTGPSTSPFERMRDFRAVLTNATGTASDIEDNTKEIWNERIGPLSHALAEVENIVVIPSGAMLGIPVEVLIDGEGVPFGERYVVSYAPSATVYTWLAEHVASRDGSAALLMGDPPYNESHLEPVAAEVASATLRGVAEDGALYRGVLAGNEKDLAQLPRLPGTRKEVTAVSGMFAESNPLVGSQATEQELVRLASSGALRQYDVLHFATHALADDQRPDRSALILSQVDLPDKLEAAMAGERIYDGVVTVKEILREWELDAELVTLSGCQTALGKAAGGEGYIGLAHAFLQVGARSLLVSLWDVEDKATSLLMQRFYENYTGSYDDDRLGQRGEPMPKATALAEAKRWLRSYTDSAEWGPPYAHPYYWAGFILIGDPS